MMASGQGVQAASEMIAAQSNNNDPGRDEGPQARHVDLAEEHRDHGEIQRARPLHRLHRL